MYFTIIFMFFTPSLKWISKFTYSSQLAKNLKIHFFNKKFLTALNVVRNFLSYQTSILILNLRFHIPQIFPLGRSARPGGMCVKGPPAKSGWAYRGKFCSKGENFTKNGITVAITLSLWYTYSEMLWGYPLAQKMN